VVSDLPLGLSCRRRVAILPGSNSKEAIAMLPEATTTGTRFLGNLPWGTHFCYFFENMQDLLDTVVPFLQAGLEKHEFCLWSIYTPITEAAARQALRQSIPDLDRYLAEGAIEIQVNPEPRYEGDVLKAHRTVGFLREVLDKALARGYSGIRVAGSPACTQRVNPDHFHAFERELDRSVKDRRIVALCYFPLADSSAVEILDASRAHRFVAARRQANWEMLETSGIKISEGPGTTLKEPAGARLNGASRSSAGLRILPPSIRGDISLSRILGALCGGLAVLLGLSVLLGWAVHSPLLIRLAPELPRMLVTSAFGFVLSGLALLGIVFNRRWLTLACSGLAALLGTAYLTVFLSDPNRIARPSALCFVVLGTGFALQQVTSGTRKSYILGVVGWLAAMIGASCAASVMWGSGDAFAMGDTKHMAFHTALGFVLLGSGAISLAVGMIQAGVRQPVWVSIGATVCLATIRIELLQVFSPRSQTSLSSAIAWLGAMFGAVIFGVFVHMALKSHLQRQVLQAVNRRLEEEMLERSRAEEGAHAANEQLEIRVEERTRALEAANEELRRQKEILQTIFDHIPVMINFGDRNHQASLVNREWERTLGWTVEEIKSQNLDILEENYPDPEYRKQVRDFVQNTNAEWADFKTTVRDGRVIDTSWAMLHLSDGTGIGIGQDITKRKRAEEALRESEERFRQLAENIHDLFWIKTPDFKRVLYFSPAYESITGRSAQDRYRHEDYEPFLDMIHPGDREKMAQIMKAGAGQEFDIEFRLVRPDGSVRWIRDRGFPIRDQSGQVYRVAGIANDITERKLAEEALRESEERFRQLAENIQDLFWIKTPDLKRVIYMSPILKRYTGRSPEETYGEHDYRIFLEQIVPEDRQGMVEIIQQGAAKEFDLEYRMMGADGTAHWIHDRGFPIRDASGQIYRMAGIARDITERKLAEAALRESDERFRQLTENIREVFWLRSPDFKQLLYVSPLYEKFCGKTPDVIYATGVDLDIVHPDDRHLVTEVMQNFNGQEFEIEYRITTKEGGVRWLRDRGFPIRNQSGDICRIGGVAEDITDRKEADDRLKASREQLRALSASLQSAREKEATRIAHQIHDELGGILTSFRWELEALEKMIHEPADQAHRTAMQDKLATMVCLTDTTINVVRHIASELRPSILDDLGLIEAVEWQTQQFQARTGIRCSCDCTLQSTALGNQESTAVFRILQEALTNILRHAQATDVGVALLEENGTFVLTVADNGRGITTAEKLSRSSLGLLSMQERAHLIGGEVEITGLDRGGTTLCVRVPLMQPEQKEGAR
jgi:PAS domain S-box-containing protein